MEGIMNSRELEEGILDIDGRIPRYARGDIQQPSESTLHVDFSGAVSTGSRSSCVAAKSMTIWRWNEERVPELEVSQLLPKGGREYCGTVYYLRLA